MCVKKKLKILIKIIQSLNKIIKNKHHYFSVSLWIDAVNQQGSSLQLIELVRSTLWDTGAYTMLCAIFRWHSLAVGGYYCYLAAANLQVRNEQRWRRVGHSLAPTAWGLAPPGRASSRFNKLKRKRRKERTNIYHPYQITLWHVEKGWEKSHKFLQIQHNNDLSHEELWIL